MSILGPRPCPCGSGKDSYWQKDARGIELCRTCPDCHDQKMSGYRAEVLTDPNYECDEEIEPEDDEWKPNEEDDDPYDDPFVTVSIVGLEENDQ